MLSPWRYNSAAPATSSSDKPLLVTPASGEAFPIEIGVSDVDGGTAFAILTVGATGLLAQLGPLTNGQLLIGSTGAAAVAASLTAGAGITITPGAGSITIASDNPTDNLIIGTTPITSGTAGRILFEGSTNVVQEDAGLAYDATNDQLQLPTTGSGAGILIGGDVQLYRSAADTLRTPDALTVDGAFNGAAGTFTTNVRVNGEGSLPADTTKQFAMVYSSDFATLFCQGPNSTTRPGFDLILQESDGGGTLHPLKFTNAGVGTIPVQLTVGSATPGAQIMNVANAGTARISVNDTSNSVDTLVGSQSALGFAGTNTNHDFAILSNNTTRMLFKNNGITTINNGPADSILSVGAGGDIAIKAKNTIATIYASYIWNAATSGDNQFLGFATESSETHRGSITYNRAGGVTAFNTTSDERAKEVSGPVTDAITRIMQFNPVRATMRHGFDEIDTMLAHEVQLITPYCVTGKRGAVDAEGFPVYQQADFSKLVPLLIAGMQDHERRLLKGAL